MSLLKYFKPVKRTRDDSGGLPDPSGPLCNKISSPAIEAANAEVRTIRESQDTPTRSTYCKLTPGQRCEIGKKVAEMGVTSAIRYYKRRFPDLPLTEPTVRRIKNSYLEELKGKPLEQFEKLKELPFKKRGRPLHIGEELDKQVQAYVEETRKQGGPINTAILIAAGTGIVMSDELFKAQHGSNVNLTKDWAKYLMYRMGLVKQRAITKAKISIENFEEVKKLFLHDIKCIRLLDEIPNELIINFDQTGINYVPMSSWMMEKQGAKRVEIIGKDNKWQITAVLAGTLNGEFLPVQLVYQGKTERCLPSFKFPRDWDIRYTANHWCNESTMECYLEKVIFPYVDQKRSDLQLHHAHPALLIFDNFNGQCTEHLLKLLESHNIHPVIIPANCTDRLQPLDISVNKPVKHFLRGKFQEWYALQICHQQRSQARRPIDLKLSIMKPLGAAWMVAAYEYIKGKPDIIKNGFEAAGIVDQENFK